MKVPRAGWLCLMYVALFACGTAQADRSRGNYGWIAATPISKYNAEDKKLLWEAADEVIASQPGFTRQWENPATGNHGTLTLLAVFSGSDGRPCRQVRVQNHAKGLSNDMKVSLCKHSTRGWLLDSEEPPKS